MKKPPQEVKEPYSRCHTNYSQWSQDLSPDLGPGHCTMLTLALVRRFFLFPVSLLPFFFPHLLLLALGSLHWVANSGLEPELERGFALGHTCNPQEPSLLPPPQAYERHVPPRAVINSAGYKILTSVDQYLELVGNSLPGKVAPIPGQNVLCRPRV